MCSCKKKTSEKKEASSTLRFLVSPDRSQYLFSYQKVVVSRIFIEIKVRQKDDWVGF
jgi:hypothetical protein